MRLVILAILTALVASGQEIVVDAGGAGETSCQGQVWGPGVAGYVDLGSPPWQTLVFNPAFSCSIPVPNGVYIVDVGLMEPNKTGPGQRLFTVSVNGLQSAPLDLFKLAGLRRVYTLAMVSVVRNGTLKLDFKATLGNAVVSVITVSPLMASDQSPRLVSETVPLILPATGPRVVTHTLSHTPTTGTVLMVYERDNEQPPYFLSLHLIQIAVVIASANPREIILTLDPDYQFLPSTKLTYVYQTED